MYVCMYVFLFISGQRPIIKIGLRPAACSMVTYTLELTLHLRNIIWFSNRKICVALKRAVLNLSAQRSSLLGALLGSLLWQENSLDVRQNTTLCDGDTRQKLVQFLVVADSQL